MDKIHLLTHEFYPKKGGAGIYCEEIAKGACDGGRDITIWAPESDSLTNKKWDFPIIQTPLKGNQGWWSRLKFRQFLLAKSTELRGSILHIAEPGAMIAFLSFPGILDAIEPRCVILTFHGTELLRFYENKKKQLTTLIAQAKRITVISPYVRELFVERFPDFSEKIVLTPGAPRLIPDRILSKASGGKEITKIICVARIHPRKGQKAILEAIQALSQEEQKRISLTLVGQIVDKEYYSKLSLLSDQLDADVHFRNDVEDHELSQLLNESDLFMMTSMPSGKSIEGLGLSYLEASAHGLAIIAHDIGGVKYAVSHNETGILVNPNNRDELRNSIRTLLNNSSQRIQMGEKGREEAMKLSWINAADMTYQDL